MIDYRVERVPELPGGPGNLGAERGGTDDLSQGGLAARSLGALPVHGGRGDAAERLATLLAQVYNTCAEYCVGAEPTRDARPLHPLQR